MEKPNSKPKIGTESQKEIAKKHLGRVYKEASAADQLLLAAASAVLEPFTVIGGSDFQILMLKRSLAFLTGTIEIIRETGEIEQAMKLEAQLKQVLKDYAPC